MKCLLISGIYRPEIGGPATYLPTLAKALIKQSNQVEVITLKNSSAPAQPEAWPVSYITRDQNLLIRFIKTVILIIRKAKLTESIFSNGLIQETAVALIFINRKSVAKVVGDPVWERARNKGLTKLSINEFNDSKLKINQKFQRWLICWSLNRFDRITCPSLELKSLMQGWGVTKPIEFIPNGVDLISSSSVNKEFDLISVCRLVSWKNLDKLIIHKVSEYVKKLTDYFPNLQLLYMAIDGVPLFAKMIEQKKRRTIGFFVEEVNRKILELYRTELDIDPNINNTNEINYNKVS